MTLEVATVHPHMRGEYFCDLLHGSSIHGSPPHAWGIPEPGYIVSEDTRFTPTCVGNTRGAVIIRFHHPVHPHMRGEYRLNGLALEDSLGSPPHAWGILYFQQYYRVQQRFTPTCVGNTSHPCFILSITSVHPHMRGEYYPLFYGVYQSGGSPPHAWGIRGLVYRAAHDQRFTPTCVGNTVDAVLYPSARAVHPHMRGEYRVAYQHRPATDGSPPHAWGIRWTSSSAWCWLSSIRPVHPHMRGEYNASSA